MTDLATMSKDQLLALVASLQANQAQPKRITMKVSEKGALSLYGVGRFPVTMYRSQWERVLGEADAIKAFITANSALLAVKA